MLKKSLILFIMILTTVSVFADPIDVYLNGKYISKVIIPEYCLDSDARMMISSSIVEGWLRFDIKVEQLGRLIYSQIIMFSQDGRIYLGNQISDANSFLAIMFRGIIDGYGFLAISSTSSSYIDKDRVAKIVFDTSYNLKVE